MSTPPVPHWLRLQFEDRVRLAVGNTQVYGQPDDPSAICAAARDITRLYPWATTADTANTLVNILGTGWGAIYLDWAHRNAGRRAA